jgi:hypothetical protein
MGLRIMKMSQNILPAGRIACQAIRSRRGATLYVNYDCFD